MPENYTAEGKRVLAQSKHEAAQLGHAEAGPEHILLAIARDGDNYGARLLADSGLDHGMLRRRLIHKVQQDDAEKARKKAEEAAKPKPPEMHLEELLPIVMKVGTAVFEHLAERLRKLG